MEKPAVIDPEYGESIVNTESPERCLLRAVVLRGVADACAEIADERVAGSCVFRASRQWRRDATTWLFSTSRKPFSFVWCMQHLFPETWRPLSRMVRARVESGERGDAVVKHMFRVFR